MPLCPRRTPRPSPRPPRQCPLLLPKPSLLPWPSKPAPPLPMLIALDAGRPASSLRYHQGAGTLLPPPRLLLGNVPNVNIGRSREDLGGRSPPRNDLFSSRGGVGKPGFPTPLPAGGVGRARPARRGMGKPGFPIPPVGGFGRAAPARERSFFVPWRCGETGFPHTPARGRGWAGVARAQGDGETGFPHPPGGRVWEGKARPGTIFFRPVSARRSRMDGRSARSGNLHPRPV